METDIQEKQKEARNEQEQTEFRPSVANQTGNSSKFEVNYQALLNYSEIFPEEASDTPKASAPQKVIQYKALGCLLQGPNSMFDCSVCGRIILNCSLAEANRHCNSQHGINLVQYYKMASGRSTGSNQ